MLGAGVGVGAGGGHVWRACGQSRMAGTCVRGGHPNSKHVVSNVGRYHCSSERGVLMFDLSDRMGDTKELC